jgi:3-hydroxyisobutyrate dehydrogenase-like beta-hydroxyacid dehydrogenase
MEPFIMADSFEGGFSTELELKDLQLALDTARDTQSPLPMTAVAAQIYSGNINIGNGRRDISSLAQFWEHITGTRLIDEQDEGETE